MCYYSGVRFHLIAKLNLLVHTVITFFTLNFVNNNFKCRDYHS